MGNGSLVKLRARGGILSVLLAIVAVACTVQATPTAIPISTPTLATAAPVPAAGAAPTSSAVATAEARKEALVRGGTQGQSPVAGSTPTPPESKDTPTPSPTPALEQTENPASGSLVAPDPNFREELDRASISTRVWKTDFSRHSVPYTEIFESGLVKDSIPPLDNPRFATPEADQVMYGMTLIGEKEPVISFEIDGAVRAFPLQILIWHEIVNAVVGDVAVAVTFCPLTNTGIVFDRRLEGMIYDFGISGKLRNGNMIMWDRQTESWWQQFTGEAIVGELTGKKLTFLPAQIISWADFKAANPEGQVLSLFDKEGRYHGRFDYGQNPYVGYDRADDPPFLFRGDLDGRLLPKERVVAVTIGDEDMAFPFSTLEQERVINYMVGDQDLVIFFKPGTVSALDRDSIQNSRDVGATGVFDVNLDGQRLTFRADGNHFVDNETESVWNILGEVIEGPLVGKKLMPIVHGNPFWFVWGAFKPDTKIYQGYKG